MLLLLPHAIGSSECGCEKQKIGGEIPLIANDADQRDLTGTVDPESGNYFFAWRGVIRTPGAPSEAVLRIQMFDPQLRPLSVPKIIDRTFNPMTSSIGQTLIVIRNSKRNQYLILWSASLHSIENFRDGVDEIRAQYFHPSGQAGSERFLLSRTQRLERNPNILHSVAYNPDRNEYVFMMKKSNKLLAERRNSGLKKLGAVTLQSYVDTAAVRYHRNSHRYFVAWATGVTTSHGFLTQDLKSTTGLFHFPCEGSLVVLQDSKTSLPIVLSCGVNFIGSDGRIFDTKEINFRYSVIRNNPQNGGYLSFGQVNHREPMISRIDSAFQATEREVPVACSNGHHSFGYFLVYNPVKEEFLAIWSNRGVLAILAQRIRAIPGSGGC